MCVISDFAASVEAGHRLRAVADLLEGASASLRTLVADTAWRSRGIDALHNRLEDAASAVGAEVAQVRVVSEDLLAGSGR